MARRIALTATLCALAVFASATSAFAHAGNPNFESLVSSVSPKIPGFSVQVLNGDDRLLVMNTGKSTVTIDGYSNDPFLRMSPGGKVEVNLRSPAYYLDQDRDYTTNVPASANPKATPQWKVVGHTGRYEFHDHRMHWMAKSIPPQVTDKSKRTLVVPWHVPVQATTAGGAKPATGAINGQLFWRGTGPGAPLGAFIAFAVIVLLGGAAVVVVRRRRAAGDGDGDGPSGPAAPSGPAKVRAEAW